MKGCSNVDQIMKEAELICMAEFEREFKRGVKFDCCIYYEVNAN